MILLIDNYDSFTYNLVQYMGEILLDKGVNPDEEIKVRRNDEISVEEIKSMEISHLVISPGPCTPDEAGVSIDAILSLKGEVPIFGVCLGHQSIGQAFGGNIIGAQEIMHGKVSSIEHQGKSVFKGLENPFIATRYHSLVIERESIPQCLEITAQTKDGEIMGVQHKDFEIHGVQFHPESILTKSGKKILSNFLEINHG